MTTIPLPGGEYAIVCRRGAPREREEDVILADLRKNPPKETQTP